MLNFRDFTTRRLMRGCLCGRMKALRIGDRGEKSKRDKRAWRSLGKREKKYFVFGSAGKALLRHRSFSSSLLCNLCGTRRTPSLESGNERAGDLQRLLEHMFSFWEKSAKAPCWTKWSKVMSFEGVRDIQSNSICTQRESTSDPPPSLL